MSLTRFATVFALACIALGAADGTSLRTVSTIEGAVTQYFVALPHIAYGGAWRTKIIVRNTSSTAADITLNYFGESGNPLYISFAGISSDHTTITIPANGERELEPDWSGPEASGWAGLVYTNSGLSVQGMFLWHDPADPPLKYTEAAAPIISQLGSSCIIPLPGTNTYTMPYDETEGRFSGYAFANTGSTLSTLTLTFYDEEGNLSGQYTQSIAGFGHALVLTGDKVPAIKGKKGTMVIGGAGIVPLGFRFTPYYTFTTWQP
jgi:hypothetical protein